RTGLVCRIARAPDGTRIGSDCQRRRAGLIGTVEGASSRGDHDGVSDSGRNLRCHIEVVGDAMPARTRIIKEARQLFPAWLLLVTATALSRLERGPHESFLLGAPGLFSFFVFFMSMPILMMNWMG